MLAAVVVAAAALLASGASPSPAGRGAPAAAPGEAEPERLELAELVSASPAPGPSARARALAGRRVRMVGFMVDMEEPPRGAFYLVERPLRCDEGGAGTGDLPPAAVRVVVRSSAGEPIPFYPGRLEVTGVLTVGHQTDDEGRPSFFQLALDPPVATRPASGG